MEDLELTEKRVKEKIKRIVGENGTISHFKKNENTIFVRIDVEGKVEQKEREMKRQIDLLIKNEELIPNIVLSENTKTPPPPHKKNNEIEKITKIIAIASGKGGVGKSSVTVAIAKMLNAKGEKVGVLDADIYGPSIPKLFGVENEKPLSNDKEMIMPIESKEGIKLNSIGFFVEPENALVWRGPMATSALKQLIHQTQWGEIDTLLIDMPPGTGDIHLTIAGELKINGAIIVTTPSVLALGDVIRGIDMLQNENISIPILGLINNMAYFSPLDAKDKKYYIFGEHTSLNQIASQYNIPILCQIPLQNKLGEEINPTLLNEVL